MMLERKNLCALAAMLAAVTLFATGPGNAVVIFSEDFETPDASGGAVSTAGLVLDQWVGSQVGFRAGRNAVINETRSDGSPWTGNPEVWSTPNGEQAWTHGGGNNKMLHTREGAVGTWQASTDYSLKFRVGSREINGVLNPAAYRAFLSGKPRESSSPLPDGQGCPVQLPSGPPAAAAAAARIISAKRSASTSTSASGSSPWTYSSV